MYKQGVPNLFGRVPLVTVLRTNSGSGSRGSLCSADYTHRPSSTGVLRARRLSATGAQTNPSIPHA